MKRAKRSPSADRHPSTQPPAVVVEARPNARLAELLKSRKKKKSKIK